MPESIKPRPTACPALTLVRDGATPGLPARESPAAPPGPAPAGAAWLPVYRGQRTTELYGWALVDTAQLSALSVYRWVQAGGYPVRRLPAGPGSRFVALHHAVLPLRASAYVDHANGDTRDARRANLRYASNSLNQANRRVVRNSSGYKGVTRHAALGKWQAAVKCSGRNFHLGVYADRRDAARAYWQGALALFGPYAWTNLPDDMRGLGDDPVSAEIRTRVADVERRAREVGVATWRTFARELDRGADHVDEFRTPDPAGLTRPTVARGDASRRPTCDLRPAARAIDRAA